MSISEPGWRAYLATYHGERPAITERLLGYATSDPYTWLVEPVRAQTGPILDLACGSAPTRRLLPEARWIGLDSCAGELRHAVTAGRSPVVRADANALPIATGSVAVVCAGMCLQVLTPLDRVLCEVRRVLRSDGILVALLPAAISLRVAGLLGWRRVLRALGVPGPRWPNPQAITSPSRILRRHGFTVTASRHREFTLDLREVEHLDLLIDGLYLPDVHIARVQAAKNELRSWMGDGRRLPLPLRRVIARAG